MKFSTYTLALPVPCCIALFYSWLRGALLVFAIASPNLLCAQFQQPTDAELKMTSDPKAPGAAAVYLNVEEVNDDDAHYHSIYARIKVLQEKGKELATVEIPYYTELSKDTPVWMLGRFETRIDDVKARTIHADGTIIPLTGKPEDLMSVKMKSKMEDVQLNRKVLNLPSVEVGSILEYYFKIRSDDNYWLPAHWEIQKPYFVHQAHYTYAPHGTFKSGSLFSTDPSGGMTVSHTMWWPVLPAGAAVKRNLSGTFTLDMIDIPPLPEEEWMPPMKNFQYKVIFYYQFAEWTGDYWENAVKDWSKNVNSFIAGPEMINETVNELTGHPVAPSKSIREAISEFTSPADSDLEKARKLYKAVQALDNTDFSRKKTESESRQLSLRETKRAEDIWKEKSGSSEEIALLYVAMLRSAGLSAKALKVVDRETGMFDPGYRNFNQLEDTIVVLDIDGKEILLDPGEKMCPFQSLHWKHSNATGFLQGSDGKTPKNTPGQNYPDNNTTRRGDLTLDSQGGVQGTLRFAMIGQEALKWRQIALRNDEDEVKKQFDKWLETIVPDGVEAHIDHFSGLDNPDVNLVAFVNAKGTLGTATSKRLLLPGFFFETRGSHPFVNAENRQEPVDMHYSEEVEDEVVYHLPDGLKVEGAPQDGKISWPSKAILSTSTMPMRGKVTISRTMARAFTFVMKDQYQDLRGFYQKVAASDQQQLVLTTASTGTGN
jgi:hypothetical protein